MSFLSPFMHLPAVECVKTGSRFAVIFLVFHILCWLTWAFIDFYILKLLIGFYVWSPTQKSLCVILLFFFFFFLYVCFVLVWIWPLYCQRKNGLLLLEILAKEYLGKACFWNLSGWTLQAFGMLVPFRHLLSHQPALLPNLMKHTIILTELKGLRDIV